MPPFDQVFKGSQQQDSNPQSSDHECNYAIAGIKH